MVLIRSIVYAAYSMTQTVLVILVEEHRFFQLPFCRLQGTRSLFQSVVHHLSSPTDQQWHVLFQPNSDFWMLFRLYGWYQHIQTTKNGITDSPGRGSDVDRPQIYLHRRENGIHRHRVVLFLLHSALFQKFSQIHRLIWQRRRHEFFYLIGGLTIDRNMNEGRMAWLCRFVKLDYYAFFGVMSKLRLNDVGFSNWTIIKSTMSFKSGRSLSRNWMTLHHIGKSRKLFAKNGRWLRGFSGNYFQVNFMSTG